MRRIILGIGVLTMLTLCPVVTDAAFITGSFDGIARTRSSIPQPDGPPIEIFIDEAVTGSFGFETDLSTLPQPPIREPVIGPDGAIYYGLATFMQFTIGDSTSLFNNDIDAYGGPQLILRTTGAQQLLMLDVSGPYWYSQMDFVAPDGGLFTTPDPATLNPLAVNVAASSAIFSGDIRSGGTRVTFNRITFDGYSQEVPTPATFALFVVGVAGAFAARRRARAR